MKIEFTVAKSDEDLRQILKLQIANLENSISKVELNREGFVTVKHDYKLLKEMNSPYPHIVAKHQDKVVGYALIMLRSLEQRIPILISMFQKINVQRFQGVLLSEAKYFVMGQVCIQKGFRGKGLFYGMYQQMKKNMASHFDYCITEVSSRNQRSLRAHEKMGFKRLLSYTSLEDEWEILIWTIRPGVY